MNLFASIFAYFRRHKIITGILIVIIVILVYLFRPKAPPPVQTITVKQNNIVQTVSVSGKVAAKSFADMSFQVGGKLVYLGVKVGDHVNQYQTIAALDSRTTQKNIQSALIDYSKQRNTFDQTQDNNQNRTPQQALNDQMKRILQNNQYDLDKAVNSVELQSLAQDQSVLTSPISGIVTRADVRTTGVNVAPTSVFEVVDPNSLVFDMDVDEADIGRIAIGQQAAITLDAYPDQTMKLPVNFIDFVNHTTSTGGNAYTVESLLSDPNVARYRVGMNGNADITTSEKDNVISIPIASVSDGKYVYVKNDQKFEKRIVTLGLQNDTDTEVVQGLVDGDVIAAEPAKVQKNQIKP